jgi:hypothetical protein
MGLSRHCLPHTTRVSVECEVTERLHNSIPDRRIGLKRVGTRKSFALLEPRGGQWSLRGSRLNGRTSHSKAGTPPDEKISVAFDKDDHTGELDCDASWPIKCGFNEAPGNKTTFTHVTVVPRTIRGRDRRFRGAGLQKYTYKCLQEYTNDIRTPKLLLFGRRGLSFPFFQCTAPNILVQV